MTRPCIHYGVVDGVGTVSFSRPDRRNAWSTELEAEYFDAVIAAAADPDVRVLVITGDPEGRAFCPGLDTQALDASAAGERTIQRRRWPHSMLTRVPKPTIAAINGACAGLGLIQALYADVRFAAEGAKFSTAFARRALPAEHGIAWILTRLVGHATAADLLLSGRTFTAEEAHELGIVSAVLPPDELMAATLAYAGDIATNCSPEAMALIKEQLYAGLDQEMEESRRMAVEFVHERQPADFNEGIRSYMEKRAPAFPGIGRDLTETVRMDS